MTTLPDPETAAELASVVWHARRHGHLLAPWRRRRRAVWLARCLRPRCGAYLIVRLRDDGPLVSGSGAALRCRRRVRRAADADADAGEADDNRPAARAGAGPDADGGRA